MWKNYRRVSNLSFLSKVLEKVVAIRLNSHINSSNASIHYQSAYRKFYSTKIPFLKIFNDIKSSMDDFRLTALTLLDYSAAFDTILLRRLGDWFGVTGEALDWFRSYLTGRCQRIKLGDCSSSEADLPFEVPQGSVLGHLLFTLYTTPLSSMISGLAIPHHRYAEHSQLYVFFSSGDSAAALNVWPLSSPGWGQINWNWTKIKLNSSLLGMNDSAANSSLWFPLTF